MTIVILGTLNLIVSYYFLIETKGINLDAVIIHNTTNSKVETIANEEEMATETVPVLILKNKQDVSKVVEGDKL